MRRIVAGVMALALAVPALAGAGPRQTAPGVPAAPPPPPVVDTDQLPVSIDRIQHKLERQPILSLELTRPTFRTEVIQKRSEWMTDIDWLGQDAGLPHPSTPRWHDEFLSMVTPPQARLYGQSNNGDLLQLAATSFVEAVIAKALVGKITDAAQRRRERKVRQEVDDAIEAWKRERDRQRQAPREQAPQP